MKKHIVQFLLLAIVAGVLGGCGTSNPVSKQKSTEKPKEQAQVQSVQLEVFAAASMTESLNEIVKMYQASHPEMKIHLTLDSSGTLKKQIEAGAPCDLFISAAKKQMKELGALQTTAGKPIIQPNSEIELLQNQVVLAVAKGNPSGVERFEDLAKKPDLKLALGNADVPVGQYSEELFRNLGIWEEIQPRVTFGSNVKEVTTWIREGVVSCGVVYATDANSAELEAVAVAGKELIQTPVLYPAAIIQTGGHAEEAEKFLEYLQGTEAEKAFVAVGFSRP